MITALVPSRKRHALLRRSITSLFANARQPNAVDVVVGVDPDDAQTAVTACEVGQRWNNRISSYVAPERFGYAGLHEYFNRMVPFAHGDWLMLWNDDAIMHTLNWDQLVDDYPVGVLYPTNNHRSPTYNVFPIVHRKLVDAMGHFSLSNHCDSWLSDVAAAAGCLRSAPNIFIEHDRFDLTGNNDDETFRSGQKEYTTGAYYSEEMARLRHIDYEKVKALALE